jgi:hypothetical protein
MEFSFQTIFIIYVILVNTFVIVAALSFFDEDKGIGVAFFFTINFVVVVIPMLVIYFFF